MIFLLFRLFNFQPQLIPGSPISLPPLSPPSARQPAPRRPASNPSVARAGKTPQEGAGLPGQPPQVRAGGGHGRPDLPQRRRRPAQPQAAILRQTDLRKCRSD